MEVTWWGIPQITLIANQRNNWISHPLETMPSTRRQSTDRGLWAGLLSHIRRSMVQID